MLIERRGKRNVTVFFSADYSGNSYNIHIIDIIIILLFCIRRLDYIRPDPNETGVIVWVPAACLHLYDMHRNRQSGLLQ